MSKFKAGDLVKLKSGGPVMCVDYYRAADEYSRESYSCDWFAGKKRESGSFQPDQLEAATKPAE